MRLAILRGLDPPLARGGFALSGALARDDLRRGLDAVATAQPTPGLLRKLGLDLAPLPRRDVELAPPDPAELPGGQRQRAPAATDSGGRAADRHAGLALLRADRLRPSFAPAECRTVTPAV